MYDGGYTSIFRRIGCIGDSLSSGEFEYDDKGIKGFWYNYEYSWGKFMQYSLHNEVEVYARGGLTAHQLYIDADTKNSPVPAINQLFDAGHACQAYIIALGVNDLRGSGVLDTVYHGQVGDPDIDIDLEDYRSNKPTFVGMYARIIQRLSAMQKGTKFFLVSMPNDHHETSIVHLKLLEGIAKILPDCYVIDLYHNAPEYDSEFRKKYYIGGHMNAMGYKLTSIYLMTAIHQIIDSNPEEFKDVPYIGSAYHPVTPFTRRVNEKLKFVNGDTNEYIQWLDDDGDIINVSDGGMFYENGRYYWYGMKLRPLPMAGKGKGGQTTTEGVMMYSSEDLYHWKKEGIILPCSSDPQSPTYGPMRFERPKIIRNEKTGKYVLWCHYVCYPGDHGFTPGTAEAGVAVCDTINGTYEFLGTYRPIDQQGLVRDLTVYQDGDGQVYLIYDRQVEHDRCLHIVRLSDDYLIPTNDWKRISVACWREAAAIVYHDGYYYMITSGLTSWQPNPAIYFRAKHLMGEWECMGNPCSNDKEANTFNSQSTYIFRIEGTETWIHMAERHNTENFERCSYIWLPITFKENHTLSLSYMKEWKKEEM